MRFQRTRPVSHEAAEAAVAGASPEELAMVVLAVGLEYRSRRYEAVPEAQVAAWPVERSPAFR